MYDTLIIDLDGPLFDGRSAMLSAVKSTIAKFKDSHGTPARDPASLPLLAPAALINVVYSDSDAPQADLGPVCDYYRGALKQAEDATDIAQPVRSWLETMIQHQWSLAVLTSRREEEATSLLNVKGLAALIKFVVGRDSGPAQKPSGAGIASILERLGKPATSAIMVGDSDSDFAAATAAGVTYIHAGWSAEPSAVRLSHPSLVFRRPEDLYHVLLQFPTVTPGTAAVPDDLTKAIGLGDLAWFAGAGVSIPSGLGGWKEQYQPLLEQTGASWMPQTRELPDTLQLACTVDDGAKVFEAFKNSFGGSESPNDYHFAILRSRAKRIWTSNYDQLFEGAISNARLDQRVVRDDGGLLNNFAAGRLVIKVNGDFENATFGKDLRWDVVLTRQQFDRALTERPEIWRLFEDDFRNRSLVFVGVSFQDPILRQVVAIATDRIPKTHYKHYLLAKIPSDPVEQTLQGREALNLEKFHIQTLWFQSHDDIRRFVGRVTVLARRPIVGVSGSTRTKDEGTDEDTIKLPNGQLTATQLKEINTALGETLARKGYRVTSGGAPYIGAEAVEAAFKIKSSRARFYFRKGGGTHYKRLAPAVIVEGDGYPDMRLRFIGELSLLVAMGGGQEVNSASGTGGVTDEIQMAAKLGVPVLLFPQAGGEVERLNREEFRSWYPGGALWPAIRKANDQCAAVAAAGLANFIRQNFGSIVDEILEASVAANVNAQAFRNEFSSEHAW
jgi:phosphoglycolate phosphatase